MGLEKNEILIAPTKALLPTAECQIIAVRGRTKMRKILFHHDAYITCIIYISNILIPYVFLYMFVS